MSINKVMLTGNLTRDPEMSSSSTGMSILNMSIAVNDRRKNNMTGEWEDYPNFIDLVMFGTRAEAVNKFLKKGSKVAVEGKLHYSSWEKDGQKRSRVNVTVDNIEFMSAKKDSGNESDSVEIGGKTINVADGSVSDAYADEDIPF